MSLRLRWTARFSPLLLLATLLAGACSGTAAPSRTPSSTDRSPSPTDVVATSTAGPGPAPAAITPLTSALTATGPAELASGTVVVDPAALVAVSADGVEFTLVTDQDLDIGSVIVIPGVAARRVTAVEPLPTEAASTGAVPLRVQTEQATIGEIFSDLDVEFGGEPEPGAVLLADPGIEGDGAVAMGDYEENPPGFRRAQPAQVSPPASPPCATGKAAQSVSLPAFSAGPYQISPSASIVPDCRSISFAISASRGDGAQMKVTLTGAATVGEIHGRATNRSGQESSLSMALDASVNVGISAVTSASTVDRAKISWDAVKIDIPVLIAGVPVVIRVGFPLIIEARFSGGADTVTGSLISMSCKGTVTVARDSSTPQSVCKMEPAGITKIMSIAPTAVVVAAGPKLGFGIGTVVGGKAVLFTGVTATLAGSVGVTYSGGAGIPVTECTRVDRAVSLNIGGEVTVLGMSAAMSKQVWVKEASDQTGQRCRPQ